MTSTRELALAAGQTLIVGFEGVEAPSTGIDEALAAGTVGGAILFSRNIGMGNAGLETVSRLNAQLDRHRPDGAAPPFISLDQEGGRVRRLRNGVTQAPPMAEIGAANDANAAATLSEIVATELTLLGFNLNFAPVLDVFTNPENTVIGDRAFGTDPEHVAQMAGAWMAGHTIAGIVPCGKHFPGHGDTRLDSHHDLPILDHDMARLEAVELIPFARTIKTGIPMIMTAHILIPALDPDHPITLSDKGLGALLRRKMRYQGVVVTDDLEMKAIADRYSIEETVELGLMAGVDIFLICHTEDKWRRAHEHLVKLAEKDPTAQRRLLQSAHRVTALKKTWLPKDPYTPPTDMLAQLKASRLSANV